MGTVGTSENRFYERMEKVGKCPYCGTPWQSKIAGEWCCHKLLEEWQAELDSDVMDDCDLDD